MAFSKVSMLSTDALSFRYMISGLLAQIELNSQLKLCGFFISLFLYLGVIAFVCVDPAFYYSVLLNIILVCAWYSSSLANHQLCWRLDS